MSIFDCSRDLKCRFSTIVLANTYFQVHVSVGILGFLYVKWTDQKFKFDGTIGYGNSYLEFVFSPLKISRLHAIVHDATGAVQELIGESPGYCYTSGRGPKSCLLDHVTGLLFCFYVKLFLSSIFKSVDFQKASLALY